MHYMYQHDQEYIQLQGEPIHTEPLPFGNEELRPGVLISYMGDGRCIYPKKIEHPKIEDLERNPVDFDAWNEQYQRKHSRHHQEESEYEQMTLF